MATSNEVLRVQFLDNSMWRLIAPWVVPGTEICVPRGFRTDFASVPRLPVVYWLFGGVGVRAATLHDWLYSTQWKTRKEADQLFYEGLRALDGVSAWKAKCMWAAVRVFGGLFWEQNGSFSRRYA